MALASLGLGVSIVLGSLWAAAVSIGECEHRAAGRMLSIGVPLSLVYLAIGWVAFDATPIPAAVLLSLTVVLAGVLLLPLGSSDGREDDTPTTRVDERDIMFSRRLLEPDSPRFESYYATNPEKRAPDDAFRALPGLLAEGASQYDPYSFGAADASFAAVESLHSLVEGNPAGRTVVCEAQGATAFIKGWLRKMGAVSVGVTRLRDYHLYSVIGRGPKYGQPVQLEHEYAIALTVEMDKEMVDRAPQGPIVMESARQYLNSGAMAVQVAQCIRGLGYDARAHIDGNYRLVCPLVARDAGLGEIGRMGLLMTPELGPRVRVAVVTTSLPLVTDERNCDPTVIDFCARCRKCADACPSRAIPFGDRAEIDGVRRWQIDSEACYTLWCKLGTDCGRCMAVCPYSHPDNLLHNLVRLGVRNSSLFRRLAIWADDIIYGQRPPPAPVQDWLQAS
jgi:ferredoxin